ncbi:MAG: 5-(carboxyamino)imidazole ribonucleotide synthase [Blastochloris sp.]|nr:5-(carboxyamino)imidazole ribonucleotide synthase [Blastochloris sp.]
MILPGSTLGLVGGGQLGRMFAIAARRMGYRVHTFEPSPEGPAGQVSDREFNNSYDDVEALQTFAASVDVITFEFENIPAHVLQTLAAITPVHPNWNVLYVCQNREREKLFLRDHHYPHAEFAVVRSAGELKEAVQRIGTPSVLKTADFGYDGKGQKKLKDSVDAEALWREFNMPAGVLEKWVEFDCELSVVCARSASGQIETFPVSENIHTNHILDFSIVPARLPEKIQLEAQNLASKIAEDLNVVGLLAVEFFLTKEGKLIVNELAPRPHNSGHYSFDACVTSQFEQQLRAVCGLPLGSTRLLSPVVMVNILGDAWSQGTPNFAGVLSEPDTKLHLYGKSEAKAGRKMGHFCVLGSEIEETLARAEKLKELL